ncbi:MAG: DUF1559 domain-containing protein [Planctomycetota bacterium]
MIICKARAESGFVEQSSIGMARGVGLPTLSRNVSAFTLVELLVTIAIIGVLLALTLPAVQAVREETRKASCKNNLHQVGVALHAYHNTHKTLPTGCVEWRSWNSPPTHRQFAWSAMLLPFLAEQNLYQKIDWSLAFDASENRSAAESMVWTYVCPSESSDSITAGHITYGGIFGERILHARPDDGVFLYERPIRFRDILDGLSNTLAAAEDVGGPDKQWINGRNVFVVAHGINDHKAWIGDNEIRSTHGGGAMVLFVDGRTSFLSDSTDKQLLGKWITRNGHEVVEQP